MAEVNLTRSSDFHKKRGVCVMTLILNPSKLANDGLGAADDGFVATLPPGSMVVGANAAIASATPTAGADVEVLVGTTSMTTIVDTTVTTPAVVPTVYTTGEKVFVTSASSTDIAIVVNIEYIEYTKTTGELTAVSAS